MRASCLHKRSPPRRNRGSRAAAHPHQPPHATGSAGTVNQEDRSGVQGPWSVHTRTPQGRPLLQVPPVQSRLQAKVPAAWPWGARLYLLLSCKTKMCRLSAKSKRSEEGAASSTRFHMLQQWGCRSPLTVPVLSTKPATCSHLRPAPARHFPGVPTGRVGFSSFTSYTQRHG